MSASPQGPPPTAAARPLLEARRLVKRFPSGGGLLRRPAPGAAAVDGVSFSVDAAQTFALVGESGCGKTTTARLVLHLETPTSGEVLLDGTSVTFASGPALRAMRRRMQMVFQDPHASLDPRMTVRAIVAEPMAAYGTASGTALEGRVKALLDLVGLAAAHAARFPHELSGGQRQRVGIARALALEPRLLVLDEPVSHLDVSIQAQVLNLLSDLQEELGLTYLLIAHGLHVVRHVADRVGVMYLGKMMETAPADALFAAPVHPYTEALLRSVPVPDPALRRRRAVLGGDVPASGEPPKGCRFHTRCPLAVDRCRREEPALVDLGGGRAVACHLRTEAPEAAV